MAAQITLHLDPVRSAENLALIIDALARDGRTTFASYAEITALIRRNYDYTDRTEPLSLARLLGLLVEVDSNLALSQTARAIHALRPAARYDVLHLLLYTAWSGPANPTLGVSWAYRACCDYLWREGAVRLDKSMIARLRADLYSAAAEQFPGATALSFSDKSLRGIRRWLEPLDPPVLEGDEFRRRDLCSRELLLLAIGQVAREDGTVLGADLLLTPERREAVCRVCLLAPSALDRRLDQVLPVYPQILAPGTRTGPYGRFIRLLAPPTIEALGERRGA
jgi:hypothetical protein